MTLKTAIRAALAATLAVTLAGCISLLPKQKPVPLYRFGAPAPASDASATTPAAGRVTLRLAPISFSVPSAGDRILTVEGDRAAYIGGGRWVAPAATLFEGAVVQTFDSRGNAARLSARGEIVPVSAILKLDVRRFEARYDAGAAEAPTVVVEIYAALDGTGAQMQSRTRLFTARVHAADNRVGPIADAFDRAVGQILVQLVDWAGSNAT